MFSRKTRTTYPADLSSTCWNATALRNHNNIGEEINSRLFVVNASCYSADKIRLLPPIFKNETPSTKISSFGLYGIGNLSSAKRK
jgi:hypothetical protein